MIGFLCSVYACVASAVIGLGASGPERHAWLTSATAFAITTVAIVADRRRT